MNIIDLAAFRPPPQRAESNYPEPDWEETADGAEAALRRVGRCTIRARYLVESVGVQEAGFVLAGPEYEVLHSDELGRSLPPELTFSVGDWFLRLLPREHQRRLARYVRAGLTQEAATARLDRELCEAGGRLGEFCDGVLFLGSVHFDLLWNEDVIASVSSLALLPFHDSVTDAESRAARWVLRGLAPRLFREGTAFVRAQHRERPRRAGRRRRRRSPRGKRK